MIFYITVDMTQSKTVGIIFSWLSPGVVKESRVRMLKFLEMWMKLRDWSCRSGL